MRVKIPVELGLGEREITLPEEFTMDSREVRSGGLFVAVPGTKFDGASFIPDALRERVAAVIGVKKPENFPEDVKFYATPDPARVFSYLCREREGRPDESLTLCGVTGTNGKTTSAFLFRHLLNNVGVKCGMLSTVERWDGEVTTPSSCTTPPAAEIFHDFAVMKSHGCRAVAMELSSHALEQGRAYGAKFQYAIFTNFTGEHLDYHRTTENYYQAKKRLFTELLATNGLAIINADDVAGQRLSAELRDDFKVRVVTFGATASADRQLRIISNDLNGLRIKLGGEIYHTELFGEYNAYNLAGVILALRDMRIAPDAINRALALPFAVPGRLQHLRLPNGVNCFVDYAHTDDALNKVIGALRPVTRGRLVVVFGAGGNRDQTKRPRMGKAAAAADLAIVTSDNPRDEKTEDIIRDIVSGIPQGAKYLVETDRRAAIRLAVNNARSGDCVLIAGKGHEDYQEIRGVKHHFSDMEELELLKRAEIEQTISEFTSPAYRENEYPSLLAQITEWRDSEPLRGVKILDVTPIFRNTCVKYLALLAAGAQLSIGVSPEIPRDEKVVKFLHEIGVKLVSVSEAKNDDFDVICDCGGAFASVRPKIGAVELTRTGGYRYQNATIPVMFVDSGKIKTIETGLGTGDGFLRGLREFGKAVSDFKKAVIFGNGKVGRGVGFVLLNSNLEVTFVDDPKRFTPLGVAKFVDRYDQTAVETAIERADLIVSAIGISDALGKWSKQLVDSQATLVAMGLGDDFGDGVPSERVLGAKKAINFFLKEPTQMPYIDPTMALNNAEVVELVVGKVPRGMNSPTSEMEQKIMEIVIKNGVIAPEIAKAQEYGLWDNC